MGTVRRPMGQRKLSDLPYEDLVEIAREADYRGIVAIPDRWTLRKTLVISRRLRGRAKRLLLPILLGRESDLRQLKHYKKIFGIRHSESSHNVDVLNREDSMCSPSSDRPVLRGGSPVLPVSDGVSPTGPPSDLYHLEVASMANSPIEKDLPSLRVTPLASLALEAGGSVRLINALEKISGKGIFTTVGSYLDAGAEADGIFRHMRNVGKGTVRELRLIVESALVRIGCGTCQSLDDDEKRKMFFENLSGSGDIVELLGKLNSKERRVITLRFGLDGGGPKTLEEVGQPLDVTRERVRQIESKAIKKLRRIGRKGLTPHLSEKSGEILARVLGHGCALRGRDLRIIGRRLTPQEDLLITVVHGSLETWLDEVAHRIRGGWVTRDVDIGALKEASDRLRCRGLRNTFSEPLSLRRTAETIFVDQGLLRIAIALSSDFTFYLGYITCAPIRKRIRRAIRAHLILGNQPRRMPMPIWQLRDSYIRKYPDDNCSTRDLEIVMGDARHLFLNMYEEGWAAIGDIGEYGGFKIDEGEPIDETQDQEPVTEPHTERTVAGILRAILHEKGPMQFDDLRQEYLSRTRGRYSQASVGPVLIGREEFVRFAPGVYGLRSQLGVPSAIDRAMQVLMTPRHLELYCHARWGNESVPSLYPMWTPKAEYRWAVWAKKNDLEELLHSLLDVADIGQWPASEAGIATWRSLKERKGEFRLQERITVPLTETIPDLRDVAAVALFARARGNVSWMSANRVRGARIDDRHVHSVLGLLIGMGVLAAPSHWQLHHDYITESNHLVDLLIEELETSTSGRWTPLAVDALSKNTQANTDLGWVDNDQLWVLIDEITSMSFAARPLESENQAKSVKRRGESSLQEVLTALKAKKTIALVEERSRSMKGIHQEKKDGLLQHD